MPVGPTNRREFIAALGAGVTERERVSKCEQAAAKGRRAKHADG
jgi:hypothetical protein